MDKNEDCHLSIQPAIRLDDDRRDSESFPYNDPLIVTSLDTKHKTHSNLPRSAEGNQSAKTSPSEGGTGRLRLLDR